MKAKMITFSFSQSERTTVEAVISFAEMVQLKFVQKSTNRNPNQLIS